MEKVILVGNLFGSFGLDLSSVRDRLLHAKNRRPESVEALPNRRRLGRGAAVCYRHPERLVREDFEVPAVESSRLAINNVGFAPKPSLE